MEKRKVIQVIGTVVDVEFPQEALPAIYNAIEINQDGSKIIHEVQQHAGNNWVRCLALCPTDGLQRGVEAIDTGTPVSVPVGKASLARLFNVFGETLDYLGHDEAQDRPPNLRPPPSSED